MAKLTVKQDFFASSGGRIPYSLAKTAMKVFQKLYFKFKNYILRPVRLVFGRLNHLHVHAAIDVKHGAGNITCFFTCQEIYRSGDIFRLAQSG